MLVVLCVGLTVAQIAQNVLQMQ